MNRPKTIAYLRVSTSKQDLKNQKLAILDYAQKNIIRIDDFIDCRTYGFSHFKCILSKHGY